VWRDSQPENFMPGKLATGSAKGQVKRSAKTKFQHLLGLYKALRLAEKGNLAWGIKPNPEDALRLRAALDYFIAENERREEQQRSL
jgi:hypothetical protein